MSNIHRFLHAVFVVGFVVISAGCDWGPGGGGDTVVFNGVEVMAEGDAMLSVEDGVLYVRNLDGTNEGGFIVDGDLVRLDVETDSINVARTAERRFGVEVRDGNGQPIADLFAESADRGSYFSLPFTFSDADAVDYVRIRYRLGTQVVYQDTLYVGETPSFGASALATASAGTGDGLVGSVHVIRGSDGRYTVVSDAESTSGRPAGVVQGGCPGFLVTPPGRESAYCTDWVEVTPLDGATRSATSTAVIGRGVNEIVVRSLVVQREQQPGLDD